MTRQRPMQRPEDDATAANRQTASLAALTLLLLLVVLGFFLVRTLAVEGAVEDCLMAGRRNCDAMLVPGPRPLP